ncbi:hypothetical protein FOZ62_020787, partial [Perkinsus olseni]
IRETADEGDCCNQSSENNNHPRRTIVYLADPSHDIGSPSIFGSRSDMFVYVLKAIISPLKLL